MNEQIGQNIFFDLQRTAQRFPYKRAIVAPISRDAYGRYAYAQLTYSQLMSEIEHASAGLHSAGFTKGTRVLMGIPPSIEFTVVTYALFQLGAIPVFIDPGHPPERLTALFKEAEAEAMIAIAPAMNLKRAFPACFETVKITVVLGGEFDGAIRYDELRSRKHPPCPAATTGDDDALAIFFTSGSTGIPKGVEFTPRMFRTIQRPAEERFKIGENDVALATFPFDLFACPMLGLTVIVPDMDAAAPGKVDPVRIIQIINDQACTYSLGSPTFWNRVAQYSIDNGIRLPTMRRLLLSTAPVGAALLRAVEQVMPNVRCYTSLGATEGGQIASIEGREILSETLPKTLQGHGVCVGYTFKDHEVRVIEITDAVISEWKSAKVLERGQIGELVFKGPTVSPRYFKREEATRRAKIYEEDGSFWHRVGDVGYCDEKGRFWFCGRVAHIIEYAGKRYYPIMVESMFNTDPGIFRTALVKAAGNGQEALVLCVEFNKGSLPADADKTAERVAELKAKAHHLGVPLTHVLVHEESFPVDARHNAKIEYHILTDWASKRLGFKA